MLLQNDICDQNIAIAYYQILIPINSYKQMSENRSMDQAERQQNHNPNIVNSFNFHSPLFCSTISVHPNNSEKLKLMSSRIYQFSQQQRLLAEKDMRIQQLLQERRSRQGEHEFIVSTLQNDINKFNNMQVEVQSLKYENRNLRFMLNEKDQLIQTLKEQIRSNPKCQCNINSKQRVFELKFKDLQFASSQSRNLQRKSLINQVSFDARSINQQPQHDAQIDNFFSSMLLIFPDLLICQQVNHIKDIPRFKIFEQVINKCKQLNNKIENIQGKIDNQQMSFVNMQHIIQQKIKQRGQLLQKNKNLQQKLFKLQQAIISQKKNVQKLKVQLEKQRKQKRAKDAQVFKLRYKVQEQKNYLTSQIRKITELVRESNSSQKKSPKQTAKNNQSILQQLTMLQSLNNRVSQLQDLLQIKQKHIQILQECIKKYTQRSKRVLQMAQEFDSWFMNLGQSHFNKCRSSYNQTNLYGCQKINSEIVIVNQSSTSQNLQI